MNLSAIIFFSRVKKYWIEGFFWRVLFPNTNIAKKLRSIAKWLISIQFFIVSYIHPRSVIVGDVFFIVIVQESFQGHGRFGKQLRGLFSSEKSNICKSSPVVSPVKMCTSMHKWDISIYTLFSIIVALFDTKISLYFGFSIDVIINVLS